MWNRLTKMMLGIVLVTAIFPVNSQISEPEIDEVPTKASEAPKIDTFSNEPYSEKIIYPLPPGITRRPIISLSDETTTADGNNIPLSSTTKPILLPNKDTIVNRLSPIDLNPSTEKPSASEKNQAENDVDLNLPPESGSSNTETSTQRQFIPGATPPTTEEPLTTEGIGRSTIEISSSSTDTNTDKDISPLVVPPVQPTKIPLPLPTVVPVTQQEIKPSVVPEITTAKPKECTTPIGKPGECKDIRYCQSLLDLLMREPLLVENKLYLQRSQCGLQNHTTVLVCCPDDVPAPIVSPKLSLLPKPRKCGTMVENRLYGGYLTEIDSYRWMSLLEYTIGGNLSRFHCGGVLISDRYVLTAAHCVSGLPENWSLKSVRLGEWDLDTAMDCTRHTEFIDCADLPIDVAIEEVIPHKDFSSTSQNRLNDIALIRLSTQVNTTDFIQPICLPYGENTLHAFDEQSLDMVGWGVSPMGIWNNIKQRTNAVVIPLNTCRSRYEKTNLELESSQFCVEGRMVNDTCRIDSGGPVISFDTSNRGLGSYYLAGIESITPAPCGSRDLPAVFTRVADYLDWILENIRA